MKIRRAVTFWILRTNYQNYGILRFGSATKLILLQIWDLKWEWELLKERRPRLLGYLPRPAPTDMRRMVVQSPRSRLATLYD